jgi:hypothetical protein
MDGNASMRQRALAVLRNEMPLRLPFITRLEAWYKSHTRANTFPAPLRGMTLDQVHEAVGVGRLKFSSPLALRLRGVEVRSSRISLECGTSSRPTALAKQLRN